jgi:ADP-ribosylglycohydrolase
MDTSPQARLVRATVALEGLSVGDAFGERFFVHPASVFMLIGERAMPEPPWEYTDDTQMALSVVETLKHHGAIDQSYLATSFGRHYDVSRGYGPAMHRLLPRIRSGQHWSQIAPTLFGGQGSFGNGSAMRVAPVGAYFADDLDAAAEHAAKSAEVTHAHREATAGAIAVAVAAVWAWRLRDGTTPHTPQEFLDLILPLVPESEVKVGIRRARELPAGTPIQSAVGSLGNGSKVTAQDTFPYTLWCAAQHLNDYEEALWATLSGLGDRDTTCAIVGGIVACHTGIEGMPAAWIAAREPLPDWDQWEMPPRYSQ